MADGDERLVVLLEARLRDFEKNMQKAPGIARKNFGATRSAVKSATDQMERDVVRSTSRINQALAATSSKLGMMGKAFVGGLVGGVVAGGITGIVSQIGDVAHGIAQIGDEAKRAGVSAKAFQEWRYVAEQNRIGIDALTDGFKELNLRADEFVITGKGSAAEAFQRLGYSAADLKAKLADPSALLLEIIGRLGQMDKAAQIRIADELFGGTAGERFVELLAQGEQGIKDTITQAHNLGIVIDDDLIKKAADLDRKFNAIANTVGTALKSAIVSAADSLAEFIDGFRSMENQRYQTLSSRSTDIDRDRLALENKILEVQGNSLIREAARNKAVSQLRIEMQKLNDESAEINGELAKRTPPMARTTDRTWTPPVSPPGGFGSTPKRDRAGEEAKREAEAVRELIVELEQELALVGATDAAKRAAAASRQAGAAATDEERLKIIALNEAIYQAEAAEQKRADAMQEVGNIAVDGVNQLADAINTGSEALDEFLAKLIDAVAQAALLGQGPLAGLFGGGLFAGFGAPATTSFASQILSGARVGLFAKGGVADRPSIFAEDGPEAAVPLPDGRRIPVDLRGAGGSQRPLNVVINEAPGTKAETKMSADGSQLEVTIRAIARDEQSKSLPKSLQSGFGITPKVTRRS